MPDTPRILHVGNPANVAGELRDAMTIEGLAQGLVVETHNNRLNFREDVRFGWDWMGSRIGRLERHASHILLLKSLLAEADLLHMHTSGRTAIAAQRWARARGKPVVRHFHGEELRVGDVREEIRSADALFVATPDLLGHVPQDVSRLTVTWIPVPRAFPERAPEHASGPVVRVVHAYLSGASYAHVFGTETLRRAVKSLRESGLPVELDEVTEVTHEDALRRYAQADIGIDKLRIGWYGAFSVECLALGLPVLAGIRDDLIRLRPPVLPVTETTLQSQLRALLDDAGGRRRLAAAQFSRAREIHDSRGVAHKVADVYRSLLR